LKSIWKIVLGVGVSFFFIWWVLRGEDLGQIVVHISQVNLWYLAASIIVGTAGYLIRALRWKVLLTPVNPDTKLRSRFAAICIGFATNNVFPARLGEIVRAFALNRAEQHVKVSGALGSVVVERLLDAIVLVAMFLVPMALPSFPGTSDLLTGTVGTILNTTFIMLAVFLVGLLALLIFPDPIIGFAENIFGRLSNSLGQKVVVSLGSFLNALEVLKHPKLLIEAFFWTLGFWFWHSWSFWLGMKAFGIDLGLDAALFTMAMVGFTIAVPAAPGFFGTFQIGADLALHGVYGVTAPATLAFAFGYHISGFFPVTIMGFYYAWKLGFSVAEVRGSKDRVKQTVGYQVLATSIEYKNNEVEVSDHG
jgi:uncharacterized protein (TIRG00374 family)